MLYRVVLGLGTALILAVPAYGGSARSLSIVVSRDTQSLVVYDGDQVVATSNVSTGKPGHSTPTGIFTILEKQPYHESNLYSSAPMPFMQRITWSGVALHESNSVPRHPASHGCVRLPHGFARQLYGMTETGVPVVIADQPLTPAEIIHPLLFRPSNPAENGLLLSDARLRLRPVSDFLVPTEVAENDVVVAEPQAPAQEARKGLRILITRRTQTELIRDIQAMLNDLGFAAGEPDGRLGRNTVIALNAFKLAKSLPVRGAVLPQTVIDALYTATGKPKPPAGQIFVRQDFRPLFDAPVLIHEPEEALGTHFLQLRHMDAVAGGADWYGFLVPDTLSRKARKRLGITGDAAGLQDTMDRITIPEDIRARIEAALTEGSTITITDDGIGKETGRDGTDFITLTHPAGTDG